MVPEVIGYVKKIDEAWYLFLLIKDDKLLNKSGIKSTAILKKEFTSEPIHNDKHIITKVKSYNRKITKHFHDICCRYQMFLSIIVFQ